jgi:hypothetical protein
MVTGCVARCRSAWAALSSPCDVECLFTGAASAAAAGGAAATAAAGGDCKLCKLSIVANQSLPLILYYSFKKDLIFVSMG